MAPWLALGVALAVPMIVAATSPLLAWRDPVYVLAGLAGVVGLGLMLIQPLLAAGDLPGLAGARGRRVHHMGAAALVLCVVVHVGGLWLTSPPDVIDALLFRSPTPFAVWGVIAMWAVFASAGLALMRGRVRPRVWRLIHTGLVVLIVGGTVLHALLIEGTMGTVTKAILCAMVLAATTSAILRLRVWMLLRRRNT